MIVAEYAEYGVREHEFNKNQVYDMVRFAVVERLVLLKAPVNEALGKWLRTKFNIRKRGQKDDDLVRVVDVDLNSPNSVSEEAADLAFRLIKSTYESRPDRPVGLGLGPGESTLVFSRRLGELLKREGQHLQLKLFGISSGCPPEKPNCAPISFFNLFPDGVISDRVALLAGPIVPVADHARQLETTVGLKEAYSARDEIDIVVTSMGDFDDHHDGLAKLLKEQRAGWKKGNWVGSVQYRPYASDAAVVEEAGGDRVVTLFELADLHRMAIDANKSVILIARPCSQCKKTKTEALLPLLRLENQKRLRVFSHLVIDSKSASELVPELVAEEAQRLVDHGGRGEHAVAGGTA